MYLGVAFGLLKDPGAASGRPKDAFSLQKKRQNLILIITAWYLAEIPTAIYPLYRGGCAIPPEPGGCSNTTHLKYLSQVSDTMPNKLKL